MGLRAKVGRLEHAMRDTMDSFELADGTRYFFAPREVFWSTFKFFTDSMRADGKGEPRPEPPELLKAVAGARDRREALARVMRGSSFLPVEREALVERGEFVPRPLAAPRPTPRGGPETDGS